MKIIALESIKYKGERRVPGTDSAAFDCTKDIAEQLIKDGKAILPQTLEQRSQSGGQQGADKLITEAEGKAKVIIAEAEVKAKEVIANAEAESAGKAKVIIGNAEGKAQALFADANADSDKIIADANAEAKEIIKKAGDAKK